jgi:hypothetical protein
LFDRLHVANATHGIGETRWHGAQPLGPVFGGIPVSPIVVMPASCENSCDMRKRCQTCDPSLPSGGLVFRDTMVEDNSNRSWLSRMWTGMHGHGHGGVPPSLHNISGQVLLKNPKGCIPAEVGSSAQNIQLSVKCDKAGLKGSLIGR